ncbi:YbdD/YjiX family protein [Streptomyces lavendofoliae]|uniref:YbdD/YjiX family protein n=1 Tax=Streptomyces lavendofoliae TaxID=67314 RepID=UPI00300EDB1F
MRRAVGWVRWYVREVSGEAAYDTYVAHVRSCDPDAEVMTRRQFERRRTDAREADPRDGFRCC